MWMSTGLIKQDKYISEIKAFSVTFIVSIFFPRSRYLYQIQTADHCCPQRGHLNATKFSQWDKWFSHASHKDTSVRMDSPIYKSMFRSMQVSTQRKNNLSSVWRFKSFLLNLEKNLFFFFISWTPLAVWQRLLQSQNSVLMFFFPPECKVLLFFILNQNAKCHPWYHYS